MDNIPREGKHEYFLNIGNMCGGWVELNYCSEEWVTNLFRVIWETDTKYIDDTAWSIRLTNWKEAIKNGRKKGGKKITDEMLNDQGIDPSQMSDEDLQALIDKNRVDPKAKIEPPDCAMMVRQDEENLPIATIGNVSMIIGKGKSKKTFLTVAMAASNIGDNTTLDRLMGTLPAFQGKIAWFDTEQGEYHATRTANRIYRLGGSEENIKNLTFVRMRQMATEIRKQVIEYFIKNNPETGLIIIDGIRDLIYDINSPDEATHAKDWLLMLTDNYPVHILVILHTNKNDNNARGHIGTELVNKCESVILLQPSPHDKEVTVVSFDNSKGYITEEFAFFVDKMGCHMAVKYQKPKRKKDSNLKTWMKNKQAS